MLSIHCLRTRYSHAWTFLPNLERVLQNVCRGIILRVGELRPIGCESDDHVAVCILLLLDAAQHYSTPRSSEAGYVWYISSARLAAYQLLSSAHSSPLGVTFSSGVSDKKRTCSVGYLPA